MDPIVDRPIVDRVVGFLDEFNPGDVAGAYLFGSGAFGQLRGTSDLDILVVARRSLTLGERSGLTEFLLRVSAANGGRAVELTVIGTDRAWLTRSLIDYQFGEWLRGELEDGLELQPFEDPDAVGMVASALDVNEVLRGPALYELIGEVPTADLHRALHAGLPDIIAGMPGDECNVLLLLARIVVAMEDGAFVTKDAAADVILPTLHGEDHQLLERARDEYRAGERTDWSASTGRARLLAVTLADRIRATA